MSYDIDGSHKLGLCVRVLKSGNSVNIRLLSDINKADLLALACVVKRIMELPVKTNIDQKSE